MGSDLDRNSHIDFSLFCFHEILHFGFCSVDVCYFEL